MGSLVSGWDTAVKKVETEEVDEVAKQFENYPSYMHESLRRASETMMSPRIQASYDGEMDSPTAKHSRSLERSATADAGSNVFTIGDKVVKLSKAPSLQKTSWWEQMDAARMYNIAPDVEEGDYKTGNFVPLNANTYLDKVSKAGGASSNVVEKENMNLNKKN